jgi:hypothetical protein
MDPKVQKPTVGRIVHFFPAGSENPEAALVIAVHSDTNVNLSVCNSGGTWSTKTSVSGNGAEVVGSERWAWPARS